VKAGDTCPRCGLVVNWVEHRKSRGHVYDYAVHVVHENGKRQIKKCYLGPEKYTYVTALHRDLGLVLKGLGQELEGEPRILDYLEAMTKGLEAQLEAEKLSPDKALALANSLEGLLPKLQGLVTKLRDYAKQAEEDREGDKQ